MQKQHATLCMESKSCRFVWEKSTKQKTVAAFVRSCCVFVTIKVTLLYTTAVSVHLWMASSDSVFYFIIVLLFAFKKQSFENGLVLSDYSYKPSFSYFSRKKKHFTPQKIGHIFTKHNFTSAAFQKHTTNYCSFNPLFLLKHNVPHWRTFLYLDCWKTFFASLIRLKTLSHGQNEPFEYEIELSWKWNPLQEHRLLFLLLSGFIVIVRWPWS